MGATARACKRIQEVGAWVLDVMWTIVMVNAGKADPKVQYLAVPNSVYMHMKGGSSAEPFAKSKE